MVIVSGKILVRPGKRQAFLELSADAITRARATAGCLDFTVSADLIEPDRVNVYEAWESEDALLRFREEGPSTAMLSLIVGAEVARHRVESSGPA